LQAFDLDINFTCRRLAEKHVEKRGVVWNLRDAFIVDEVYLCPSKRLFQEVPTNSSILDLTVHPKGWMELVNDYLFCCAVGQIELCRRSYREYNSLFGLDRTFNARF
jgi:hypothetical protein